jgi:hypothetical protein
VAFSAFSQTVTGTRTTAGGYVDGLYQPGTSSAISINSSVQPSTDREIELLPEGERQKGAYTLRSKTEVLPDDVFDIYGDSYRVLKVQRWTNSIIPHWQAIAVKVDA